MQWAEQPTYASGYTVEERANGRYFASVDPNGPAWSAGLRPGMKVLHFAPEIPLFPVLAEMLGETYHVRDIDVERYSRLRAEGVSVERFDLCNDCPQLPSNYYDLILHNHVLEHIPCNITAVLWHLHRSLAPDGLHMFSVPIFGGHYEEDLGREISPEDRQSRFHHPEHLRNFGRDDLRSILGMIFTIEDQLKSTLLDHFSEADLERFNIPKGRWRKFSGVNLFMLRKDDLILSEMHSGAR